MFDSSDFSFSPGEIQVTAPVVDFVLIPPRYLSNNKRSANHQVRCDFSSQEHFIVGSSGEFQFDFPFRNHPMFPEAVPLWADRKWEFSSVYTWNRDDNKIVCWFWDWVLSLTGAACSRPNIDLPPIFTLARQTLAESSFDICLQMFVCLISVCFCLSPHFKCVELVWQQRGVRGAEVSVIRNNTVANITFLHSNSKPWELHQSCSSCCFLWSFLIIWLFKSRVWRWWFQFVLLKV